MKKSRIGINLLGLVLGYWAFGVFGFTSTSWAKPRVGIVGAGGGGLVTAFLLQDQYDVTIFEEKDKIGGHTDTVMARVGDHDYPIDAGWEFWSVGSYPHFNRLLWHLKVPIATFELTYTLYNTNKDFDLVLPPKTSTGFSLDFLRPKEFIDVLGLACVRNKAKELVNSKTTDVTIEEYVNQKPGLKDKVKEDFLYPFFAGMWGTSVEEIKTFAAYPVLSWILSNNAKGLHAPWWNEIKGGTAAYLEILLGKLNHTKINVSSKIQAITYDGDEYRVWEKDGTISAFDYLVIATNASQAKELLKEVPEAEGARNILSRFKYFHTLITVHGDKRLMPPNEHHWSVFNIRTNGQYSSGTVYKQWRSPKDAPVFRSWVTHNHLDPNVPKREDLKPVYANVDYYHPYQTVDYFQAQRELEAYQGKNNLWFAGVYTHDVVNYESVVIRAMKIAEDLAPDSMLLRELKYGQSAVMTRW